MENLPVYIPVLFTITTMLTLILIAKAFGYSKVIIVIILAWLIMQALLASTAFYTYTTSLPPRFLLAVVPPFIIIIFLFSTAGGRKMIDNLPTGTLILLHVVRIPVEIILLLLFIHKTVPVIMTFEGQNFDIFSGITAPVVYFFGFLKKKMMPLYIIMWNILCLILLANIVFTAILSAPFPFQQFAFDQPNIAVLHAPYIWLPCFIVPVVFLSHTVVIRQMKRTINKARIVEV